MTRIGLTRRLCCSIVALATCGGLAAVGCSSATTGGTKGSSRRGPDFAKMQPFPSASKLEKIAATQRPDLAASMQDVPADVSSWTMAEDLPEMAGAVPYEGDDPTLRAAAEILSSNPALQPTAAMMCFAREYGRFRLAHKARPPNDIWSFMTARCGVHVTNTYVGFSTRPRPEGYDGRLDPENDADALLSNFAKAPEGSQVGAWLGASEDEVILVGAHVRPDLEIEPLTMTSGGTGSIDLRGKLPWNIGWVQGVTTDGEFGHRSCDPIPNEAPGVDEIALRCTVDKGDPSTIVEVVAAKEGRLLGSKVFLGFFSPDGSAPKNYEAPSYGLPVDALDRSNAARLDGINGLRQRAGLDPMRLSEVQSQAVTDLAPHFLDPEQRKFRDDIALGMMAGWGIEEAIRDAEINTHMVNRTWDLERELAGSMFSPYFRKTVLSDEGHLLASGTIDVEAAGTRAVVDVVYSLFEPRDFAAETRTFFDELDLQRMAAGLPPVIRVNGPNDVATLRKSAERIRKGESTPTEELDVLANHFAQLVQRSFFTVAFAPMRLDGWRPNFPDELFKHEHIAAAATISYFKPPRAAWGQHIVLMVYTILEGPLNE